ncbi:MAG: hypothetical protein KA419_00810 [Acidobacteria bacterium]|nr:hypothetical protein [Acidobacteriota bacterium]
MKARTLVIRPILFLSILLLPVPWAAARTRPVTLPETAALARDVAVVTCTGQSVNQAPGNGQLVFTTWMFRKESALKDGGLPETFSLKVIGGTVGKLRVTVPDAPVFLKGKHYVVFLRPKASDPKAFLVCGASRGVLEARKTAAGAWEVQLPAGKSPAGKAAASAPGTKGAWVPLSDFTSALSVKGGRP